MKIEIGCVQTDEELHLILAKELGFPSFYGKNWDAFRDAITGLVELPHEIEFIGCADIEKNLPKSFSHLRICFQDLSQQYPSIGCKLIWS